MENNGAGASGDAMRLLIADDHDLVRRGLRGLLRREPDFEIVGEAENGKEAVELCRSLAPDLVLMDVRMPGMDGLEATRAIKQERPEIGVLMVTMHDDPDYMLEAIKAGAAGYVLKDASWEDLTTSVRRGRCGECRWTRTSPSGCSRGSPARRRSLRPGTPRPARFTRAICPIP